MTFAWPPTEPFDDREPWPRFLPGRAAAGFPAIGVGGLGHPDVMSALWCRLTLDDAQRYYQAARQCSWANWAIDRGEDWSPTERHFARWVQAMWIAGCRLVISAHLAQQWVRIADPTVPEVPGLRRARNAIEHLHEAEIDESQIIATTKVTEDGKQKAWDIEKLPDGRLIFGMGKKPLEEVFDAVSLEAIVAFALEHSDRDGDVDIQDSTYLLRPSLES
ncbi:hypothetical protein [Nocardioides sp.]|uniref:hypothetical protein n=1 Tax=Nocardioides sp. TaxID=35761 RepID=UPI00260479CE|nr:hypothetical protein [Nocardioides sp.]MDI6911824.1 hypothetical protein [Nocardioides sp.]